MAKQTKNEEAIDLFDMEPDELDDAIAGLPTDDATLTIYRCKPAGQGHPVFVAIYPPAEFTLERIQENHGGGKYNIIAKRGREIVKRMRVEIEGEPKAQGHVPLAARRPGGYGGWFTKQQLEQEEQKAKMTGVDPAMMMLLNEIKNLKDSLQNANPSVGKHDRREFLEELVMYKNLFAPPSSPIMDNSKMVTELIQKGLEIGANAANGEPAGGGWLSIVRELLPVAQQAISAAVNKQNVMLAATRPVPVAPNGTAPENSLKPSGFADMLPGTMAELKPQATGFQAIAPMLVPYLPLIIGVAARDGNPEAICETIEANIGEEQKPRVIEWLQGPTWFDDLSSIDPRIKLQSAWWQELHGYLLGALTGIPSEPTGDPDEQVQ